MTSKFLEETNKDFKEFKVAAPVAPPKEVTQQIFSMVHGDLNPNSWLIFSKMALVHFFVGLVTLSICPQFGLRFFGEGHGVMKFFLHFGVYWCSAFCGAFFIGTSLFTSSLILRSEELKVLRNHRWLQVSALTFLSLGAFVMSDAEILISFGLAWAVGSVLGGIAMLEVGRVLKMVFVR